ncbi:prolipoprotein diacylglyceryl transferase [Candidatus Dependentiae bacterium]|nr:prolipoprotein diacylglyceryl transferase [Candidatus Dependentiae bacterium]
MFIVPDLSFSLFSLFNVKPYGLMLVVGLWLFSWHFIASGSRQLALSRSELLDIIFVGLLAGVLGGRLFYLLESGFLSCGDLICGLSSGGLSVLGAIIAVPLALYGYAWAKKISFLNLMDQICLHAPLLDMYGRIGCFFAGCCFGLEWDGFFSIAYQFESSGQLVGVPLFPIQLVAALLFSVMWSFFVGFDRVFRQKPSGSMFMLYLFCASLIRFVLDFWRGDRPEIFLWGCTKYQFLGLGIMLFSGTFLIYLFVSAKKRSS